MSKTKKNNRNSNIPSKAELRQLIQRYQRLASAAYMRDDYPAMNKWTLASLNLQQELAALNR